MEIDSIRYKFLTLSDITYHVFLNLGIIPREAKPKYTVRDVKKRESERKGRDKYKRLSNGGTESDSEYPDYKNIPQAGMTSIFVILVKYTYVLGVSRKILEFSGKIRKSEQKSVV